VLAFAPASAPSPAPSFAPSFAPPFALYFALAFALFLTLSPGARSQTPGGSQNVGTPAAPAPTPSQTPASSPNIDAPKPAGPAAPPSPNVDAQSSSGSAKVKTRFLIGKFPDKPSIPPSISIPVEPLGFVPPGAIYMGARNALASLDFIDENRLLFTFHVPGLLHRETAPGQDTQDVVERKIRAVVLTLPQGAIETETQWTVHDRVRYIWMLANGHFLFRDRNNLLEGDSSLKLKPLLDFPGPLLWLDLDPAQQYLVTNSREPQAKPAKPGEVPSPSTASADVTVDADTGEDDAGSPDMIVRILRRDTGDVMLVSRVRSAVHLPINSEGYLENLRGRANQWMLNLSYFNGGSKILGSVDSNCSPSDDFLSPGEVLATGCGPAGESKLVAITTAGKTLWTTQAPSTEIWPQLVVAANGSRLAWETLDTSHPVNSFAPLGTEDIKEQSVTVFDAATGDIPLVSPVSPMLDAGGNVAISPSGRRVALLNAGAIQVFDLPAPSALPAPKK
jgi:hypothetical protein